MMDLGFEQIALFNATLFDYHAKNGDPEVTGISGLVRSRRTGNELEGRSDTIVETITALFRIDAALGILAPGRGDYITDAGQTDRFYYSHVSEANAKTNLIVFRRVVETETGPAVGQQRQYV